MSKRMDKLEEMRKNDMEEIRAMFGDMNRNFMQITKRLDVREGAELGEEQLMVEEEAG